MKILFAMLGVITLVIGIIGIVLPLLPTTPFLLLSMYCFGRGSLRIDMWLKETWLYKKYGRREQTP